MDWDKLIPGHPGPGEAGADNAASGLELALDREPHGERRRAPAACRQAAEYAVTSGVLIEMKGLRIELGGKALDPIAVQPRCNRSSAVGGIALTSARLPFYCDLGLLAATMPQ